MKLLEEHTGVNFYNLRLGNDFLDMIPKTWYKRKNGKF